MTFKSDSDEKQEMLPGPSSPEGSSERAPVALRKRRNNEVLRTAEGFRDEGWKVRL